MPKVQSSRWLPYPQETVYNTLADIDVLASIVKRIEKIEVVSRTENEGQVKVMLDIPFHKVSESTGDVKGTPHTQMFFRTDKPFQMEFMWKLIPKEKSGSVGTDVQSSLDIDLSAFVPGFSNFVVEALLVSELEADLKRLEEWMKKHTTR